MEDVNAKIDGNKSTQTDKLTKEKKEELVDALKQELEEKMSGWDIDAFGEYVMQYCTKNEDWELQINLPAKWKFKWFKFSWDSWNLMLIFSKDYNNNDEDKELRNKLGELIYALEDYVKAYWIEMDGPEIQKHILNPILKKYHIRDN